MNWKHRASIS